MRTSNRRTSWPSPRANARKVAARCSTATRLICAYVQQFGVKAVTLLVNEQGAQRPEVHELVEAVEPRRVYLLADDLFDEITKVETPEGVAAIVDIPRIETSSPDDFRLVLDSVQDPGNVGGLLRTAAAAGATSAYLAKGCADAWSPKSLRGGMGAQFVLPMRERVDLSAALSRFKGSVIATSPRAKKSIFEVDLTGPVAMIFGGEGRGVGENGLAMATQLVHIPMARRGGITQCRRSSGRVLFRAAAASPHALTSPSGR